MNVLSTLAQATYDYNYSGGYSSSSYDNTDPATTAAIVLFSLGFAFIVIAIAYVITSFLLMRIFKKAGVESWKAWVPVYNNWVMLELGGQQGFWAVLAFIPIVNIASVVFMLIAQYHIGLRLGKEGVFVLWAIFIPIVWFIWLAFDDSKWDGKKHPATPVA
jgi:magnesium-transporting ATPase (P-type)